MLFTSELKVDKNCLQLKRKCKKKKKKKLLEALKGAIASQIMDLSVIYLVEDNGSGEHS